MPMLNEIWKFQRYLRLVEYLQNTNDIVSQVRLLWAKFRKRQFAFKLGYEISAIETEYKQLMKLKKKLKIEYAHLKSSKRIAEIAENKFGLIMPSSEQIVIIGFAHK